MAKKCIFCEEKIEEDSIGKIKGTMIRVKKDESNEFRYVCSDCQKSRSIDEIKRSLAN